MPHHCIQSLPSAEEWRPAPGFEGWYEVSSHGRIRRIRAACGATSGKVLRAAIGKDRRAHVTLTVNRHATSVNVHRLVARAFLGEPPSDHEVNHLDGNPSNNCADNLEWTTRAGQFIHAVANRLMASGDRNGTRTKPERRVRGDRQWAAKLTDAQVVEARTRYAAGGITQRALAADYGISLATMNTALHGKTWGHVTA